MAQIVTITNPLTGQPAQVDQLEHTAQQIDDAIARALPGGAIDKALANNDPRQWGLGANAATPTTNDANSCTLTGWYGISSMSNCPFAYGLLRVEKWYDGCIFQTAYEMISGVVVQRRYQNSEWKPWEYVNPPMTIGVEYRTTELYQGKPVYVKLVDCGALPNNTIKNIAHGSEVFNAISCILQLTNSSGNHVTAPEINYDKTVTVFSQLDHQNILVVTNGDFSSYSAVAKIKYTKTTN